MIISCVNTVEFSLLINGSISKEIRQSRGLRQGDPLSPFLFSLRSEVLSRLLRKKEKAGLMHGIKVHMNAAISHLMYANDLLIMSRAKLEEVDGFLSCLRKYYGWSGQKINEEKSSILFSNNSNRGVKRMVQEKLGYKEMRKYSI